jgi:hypothetical protein
LALDIGAGAWWSSKPGVFFFASMVQEICPKIPHHGSHFFTTTDSHQIHTKKKKL